ncbi:hypothetical protein ASE74_12335 [Pedobacter sp. Leaf216]|uniref:glycosyltransferase family 61 protein n=1 Tax=Pedobacter sp. Leaf216 TaxID=1735684 RepID=UPI0006F3BD20|nr:glycosyltransferase family 61 protein [Pedobacter sp. Leaf216]KQM63948.1 hypothetical protein ASE74_12335 [Pedobacter sp. Leaf216]
MKILKKIIIFLFTNHPYRIKSFLNLYPDKKGEEIDVPERKSMVLKIETGKMIVYPNCPSFVNAPPILRTVSNINRYELKGVYKEPDRILYKLLSGTILSNNGLVYDRKKRAFIEESAKEWTIRLYHSPFTNVINYPPKKKLEGIVLSCLTNGADGGFYHFFLESLPKLHYCHEIIELSSFILLNGPKTDWKLGWLKKANIDIDKVIWVMNTDHIECDQLIFTNRLIHDQQISKWCINSLLALFNIKQVTPAEKFTNNVIIWITREGLKERHIKWEEDILMDFPKIERIDLNKLTPDETIDLLQKSTHVISPHGAGLSNIIFCNSGTKILEILPNDKSFQPCYSRISSMLGFEHSIINVDFMNPENQKTGVNYLRETLCKFI